MRRELVELYFDGMDIEMLGWHFEMKAFEVYRELISLLLGVTHLEEDRRPRGFANGGNTWTTANSFVCIAGVFPLDR